MTCSSSFSDLTFDAEKHEYRLNGFVVPSVTQALAILYNFDVIPKGTLEYARDRGIAVHAATALYDQDNLDEESLDPVLRPYLDAWKEFCGCTGFFADHIEARVHSSKYRYAGTLDRVGTTKRSWGLEEIIVDIKTATTISPVTGPQLAAYEQACRETFVGWSKKPIPRFTVQLRDDGTYRMHQHKDRTDFQVFQAALQIYQWRAKCK